MKIHTNKMGVGFIALLGFGLMLFLLGCEAESKGKNEPVVTKRITTTAKTGKPPAKQGAKQAADPAGPSKADAPAVETARLPYDPIGKVDPFQPLFKEEPKPKVDRKIQPQKPQRPRTPLERLDLGQLQLTAIIFSETKPRAMVEEASGKGYVIQIGTYIGLERGQVTDIQRDRIIIEHSKTDDFGNTALRQRELKLQKPPGD
jgi:type IV pilus assembly protein PilP